jgi:hypothetical protein
VPPRRRPSRADCELGQVCGQPGARGVCAGVAATLFGNAEVLEDGNVRLVADADTAPPSAGVRFDIGAGVDIPARSGVRLRGRPGVPRRIAPLPARYQRR